MPRRRRQQEEANQVIDNPEQPQGVALYGQIRGEDSTMIGPSGGFVRAKRVHFTLSNGTSSYIEVPLTDFKRSTVERLIEQHVSELLEVMNIQGPLIPG